VYAPARARLLPPSPSAPQGFKLLVEFQAPFDLAGSCGADYGWCAWGGRGALGLGSCLCGKHSGGVGSVCLYGTEVVLLVGCKAPRMLPAVLAVLGE